MQVIQRRSFGVTLDLHEKLAAEVTKNQLSKLLGVVMDNTKANRAAGVIMNERHPEWLVVGCYAHALSLLLKDFKEKTKWGKKLFTTANQMVNTINDSELIRALINKHQMQQYGKVRSLCAAEYLLPTAAKSR